MSSIEISLYLNEKKVMLVEGVIVRFERDNFSICKNDALIKALNSWLIKFV